MYLWLPTQALEYRINVEIYNTYVFAVGMLLCKYMGGL
jgi:hypothetical protein